MVELRDVPTFKNMTVVYDFMADMDDGRKVSLRDGALYVEKCIEQAIAGMIVIHGTSYKHVLDELRKENWKPTYDLDVKRLWEMIPKIPPGDNFQEILIKSVWLSPGGAKIFCDWINECTWCVPVEEVVTGTQFEYLLQEEKRLKFFIRMYGDVLEYLTNFQIYGE